MHGFMWKIEATEDWNETTSPLFKTREQAYQWAAKWKDTSFGLDGDLVWWCEKFDEYMEVGSLYFMSGDKEDI